VSSTSQPENNENMKIVDEAVFKNIVSRLDKLEQTNVTPIQTQQAPSVNNNDIQLFKDEINNNQQNIISLKDEINNNQQNIISLKDEINELKNIILQLQSYTMNTNQKLCDIIFSNENDEKNISDELTKLLSHTENEIDNGLDEYLSASLNGIIINDVDETENVSVETQNLNINI
jgi:chromosome segregation ATPase